MPKYQYHLIYETVNLVNGKYYRGKHSTDDPDDGYLGSGYILKQAIEKHNKHNFEVKVLFCAFTEEDAYYVEKNIFVTVEQVKDPLCYNQITGGKGAGSGEGHIFFGVFGEDHPSFGNVKPEAVIEELREAMKGDNNPMFGTKRSEEVKKAVSKANTGRKHTLEARESMSAKRKGRPLSEEAKHKLSLKHKGKELSLETRRKLSAANSGESNHFYGKNHSEETKQKMSLAKFGENHHNAKPVIVSGQRFPTRVAAARYFAVDPTTILNWIKAGKHGAYFIDDE